uniref:RNA-directed DNA polymerase, eukaryota n=1 Tax=Tanacetum cinerariifolium TaxID=118510 RepID=A0A6L2KIQ7_TANCI|nr:RNA-directed DNA polymerase, eukaryota [Tanacetum cinerariifolium]
MREAHYDYGPIPFKFFHYWFELDGFDKLVEQTWLEANVNDQDSYSKFMNKLKYLKEKIRIWTRRHKESLNSRKSILKAELADLDGVIDKGEGSDADGHRRREVVRLIQEAEKWEEITYYIGICSSRFKRKKMLWDYLLFVIGNWDDEVVIMGDFNEVRDISERFGSIFNKHGAEAFNYFIVNAGLVEVPLGDFNEVLDISEMFGSIFNKHGAKAFNSFIVNAGLVEVPLGEGSDDDGHRRREVVRLIQEVEKFDAMKVAQKAKIKWFIEGDENSKYYHDGIWMESPHLVKHEFFEHFKNRFEKPNKSCILLERNFVKRISLEQNDDLEREVSNEEIKRAVWDCGIDKAPEPDGFTFGFYRWYWDIIGNDVVDAFKWFFCMERSRKEVLANRLVTVLDDIVDEIQSAFVTDRPILDGPLILNEIVHWCKNKKKQSMIFKVDFKKAYDSVRWDFIDDILRRFGFGEKWLEPM